MDSRPIQAQLGPLLSLLNLKNHGQMPDLLMGSLQPTMDLAAMLTAYNRVHITGDFAIGLNSVFNNFGFLITGGGGAAVKVPPDELWFVHGFSVSFGNLGGAEKVGLRPVIYTGIFQPVHVGELCFQDGAVFAVTSGVQSTSLNGMWVPGGYVFGCSIAAFVGAARSVFCDLEVTRLKL